MKEEMKSQLIKDIVTAAIAWVVVGIVFGAFFGLGIIGGIFVGLICAGVPFGWRWLSNIFTAISFYVVMIKFVLAVMLGWIALPVVIIKDIIAFVNAE